MGTAVNMIENVIGTHGLPLGIATNFIINGKEYLIPFAIEEASVVAAASYGAKLAKESSGFTAESDQPVMIGQIQIVGVPQLRKHKRKSPKRKPSLFLMRILSIRW